MEEYYEEDIEKKKIKKKIIIEYVIFLFAIIIPILLNIFLLNSNNSEKGLDYIRQALGFVIIARLFNYFITFISCFIYPIIVFRFYKKSDLRESLTRKSKILYNILIILPILYACFTIFSIPIQNLMYNFNYNRSFGDYKVKESNYKLPKDFYDELKNRNLLYDNKTSRLMNRLNCVDYEDNTDCPLDYVKATMTRITKEMVYDVDDRKNITDYYKGSPVYMYNSIIVLPSIDEKLQYAAIGRFSYNSYDLGDHRPVYDDYYIECKILYVDGDIYAIIGVGASYSVEKYFNDNDSKAHNMSYIYPYYMVLTEKTNIKTYASGRYHPKGSIQDYGDGFEMHANNKNNSLFFQNYPIKKVKKLNKNTIDKVANELQNGILKESIKEHYNGKDENE